MEKMYMSSSNNMVLAAAPAIASHLHLTPKVDKEGRTHTKLRHVRMFAANSGGFSLNSQKNNSRTQATRCDCQILNGCKTCGGKGAIECPGCKGTGKNKKNGNIFERWKCFDCQGFGLKSCPNCGRGGLTPEQRGER